jgi:hypothetical protein
VLTSLCDVQVSYAGALFLKAVDTSGMVKTAVNIASVLIAAILEVGPENVVQLITDSAANCKKAGEEVQKRYLCLLQLFVCDHVLVLSLFRFPHIQWTPCTAHIIDLYLEDIGKLEWAAKRIKEAKAIVKLVTLHHAPHAIFRSKATLELVKPGMQAYINKSWVTCMGYKSMLCAGETRFGTHFMMMDRLLQVKMALKQMVVSDEWVAWTATKTSADKLEKINGVVECIEDNSWWKGVHALVDLTRYCCHEVAYIAAAAAVMKLHLLLS